LAESENFTYHNFAIQHDICCNGKNKFIERLMNMSSRTKASKGGNAVVELYGTSWMRKIGRKGGNATVDKYGTHYMTLLAKSANPSLSFKAWNRIRTKLDKIVASGQ